MFHGGTQRGQLPTWVAPRGSSEMPITICSMPDHAIEADSQTIHFMPFSPFCLMCHSDTKVGGQNRSIRTIATSMPGRHRPLQQKRRVSKKTHTHTLTHTYTHLHTLTHFLCEPAQAKRMSRFHKSHFILKVTGKIARPQIEPGMHTHTHTHTLCEPAQSKRMSRFHKSHFILKFTGKMPGPRLSPERKHTFFASLRRQNACQDFTRATSCRNS